MPGGLLCERALLVGDLREVVRGGVRGGRRSGGGDVGLL